MPVSMSNMQDTMSQKVVIEDFKKISNMLEMHGSHQAPQKI